MTINLNQLTWSQIREASAMQSWEEALFLVRRACGFPDEYDQDAARAHFVTSRIADWRISSQFSRQEALWQWLENEAARLGKTA